jgi:hypothetical protein
MRVVYGNQLKHTNYGSSTLITVDSLDAEVARIVLGVFGEILWGHFEKSITYKGRHPIFRNAPHHYFSP